ncbi:hypothetical protein VBK54_16380, partial [Enterobacter hormaechei]|nr:hypothetical protein [Enterobacter hormaechei]
YKRIKKLILHIYTDESSDIYIFCNILYKKLEVRVMIVSLQTDTLKQTKVRINTAIQIKEGYETC